MRFAFFSTEGTSLPFWKRLQDEGHDVLVYVKNALAKDIGDGIVPKTANYAELVEWGKGGIYYFDFTGDGARAEALRRGGQLVFGGGMFCDRLEKERMWGQNLAEQAGCLVPETHPFGSISEAVAFLKKNEGPYYFKPDKDVGTSGTCSGDTCEELLPKLEDIRRANGDAVRNILQEKICGSDISTLRYWNGKSFVGPYEGTIEHKPLMNDEKGPATGCSINAVWFYETEPDIAAELNWDGLTEIFRKYNAPPAPYDINAIVSDEDGKPRFLEFTPRLGYDAEPTALVGISDYCNLVTLLVEGGDPSHLFDLDRIYAGVRFSVPPYSLDEGLVKYIPRSKTPYGLHIGNLKDVWGHGIAGYGIKLGKNGYEVADPTGLLGVSVAGASTMEEAFKKCYEQLEVLQVRDIQYRTDAYEALNKHFNKIADLGYETFG